jgi:hypothetical protein
MRGSGNELHSNQPDTTDPIGPKLRRAVDWVEKAYDDRWPARGQANIAPREYRPLEDVSRGGRPAEYKKRPNAKG